MVTLFGKAQENKQQFLFVDNNFSVNGKGVALKWISSEVYFDEGCKVYRKENGDWQLLTPNGINFQKNGAANLDEEDKGMLKVISDTEYSEFKTSLSRMFVLIQGVLKTNFADVLGIQYFDETAEIGKTYTYKVIGISEGVEKQIGVETTFTVGNYQKPLAPKEIKLERTKNKMAFKWQPELDRYYAINVYKKSGEESDFKKVTEVPFTLQKIKSKSGKVEFPEEFFTDLKINDDKNYTYKITAVNFFGQESVFSSELFTPAQDFIAPEEPFNLKPEAFALERIVKLNWQFVDETDLEGFNIYRGVKLNGEFKKLNNVILPKISSFYEDLVPQSGNYYYYVSTIDFSGNETKSGLVYIEVRDLVPPAAPNNVEASTEPGKITLNWTPNSETDLKGYFIQRSLNDSNNLDNNYINVNKDPITETSYTEVIAKKVRNKFVYRVVAVDTSYNRSKPSINSLAQMPDVTPPMKVLVKKVEEKEQKLIISWLANVEPDLKGYNVYRRLKGDSGIYKKVNFSTVPLNILTYTDRTIEEGVLYEYMVKAVDQSENLSTASKGFIGGIKLKKGEAGISIVQQKLNKRNVLQLEWKNDNEAYEIRGYVVFKGIEESQLRPMSGMLTEPNFKQKLENKSQTFFMQIRAYATSGEVIKTEVLTMTTQKRELE